MTLLFPLYIVIFLAYIGFSMAVPIFSELALNSDIDFLPRHFNLTQRTTMIGVLLSLYPLGQFFGNPVAGALSDRFGRRPLLLITLVFTTISYIGISLSMQWNLLIPLLITLFCAGFFEGNVVIAQTAIADVSMRHQLPKRFALIPVCISSAFIFGPLLAGYLSDKTLVSWFDPALPFWCITVILALFTLYLAFFFKETQKPEDKHHVKVAHAVTNLKHVFTDHNLRAIYLFNFLAFAAIFGYFRTSPAFLIGQFHVTGKFLGQCIAMIGLPVVLFNLVGAAKVIKKFNMISLSIFTAIYMGIFFIWYTWIQDFYMFFPLAFFAGIGIGTLLTVTTVFVSEHAGKKFQGRALGNNASIQVAAVTISTMAGNFLASFDFRLPITFYGILSILSIIVPIIAKKKFEPIAHNE